MIKIMKKKFQKIIFFIIIKALDQIKIYFFISIKILDHINVP